VAVNVDAPGLDDSRRRGVAVVPLAIAHGLSIVAVKQFRW
jgi:hypothetical protein